MLTGLFLRLGLGPRLAALAGWATIAVIVGLALLWLRADAYHDGERAANERWVEAGRKLEARAEASGRKADVAAAARMEDHRLDITAEKEKLDEAAREGTDPFDVLFGPTGL